VSTQYGPALHSTTSTPAPTRPATLAAAFWLSVSVGLLALIGAIIMIVSGKEAIRTFVEETVRDTLGADVSPELIESTVGSELDEAYRAMVVKAVVAIVIAVLILLFALIARNAGMAGRIGLTIALVAGMCGGSGLQLGESEVIPSASFVVAAITPMLSLIAIICLYLPPTNRYAKARKTAARV
jgi:hypothetical protein